jgi:hypothetical protein
VARTRQILSHEIKPTFTNQQITALVNGMSPMRLSSDYRTEYVAAYAIGTAGDHRAAEQLAREWVAREEDPRGYIILGDLRLYQDDPLPAADYYRQAAPYARASPTLMFSLGCALSQIPEKHTDGEELMAFAPFLALGDGEWLDWMADDVRHVKGAEGSSTWRDLYLARYANLADDPFPDRLSEAIAVAEKRKDFSKALESAEQALFCPREVNAHPTLDRMLSYATYQRLRALDALSRNDMPALLDALTRHLDAAPPDVALLEKSLPLLRQSHRAAADELLTRSIDRLAPIVEDYPQTTEVAAQLKRLKTLR